MFFLSVDRQVSQHYSYFVNKCFRQNATVLRRRKQEFCIKIVIEFH